MAKARFWVLVALLVGITAVWGVAFAQNWYLEQELAVIAEGLEKENETHLSNIVHRPVATASVVTAAMDHVVYGQPMGKISVYMTHSNEAGQRIYQGIEYHYLKEESTWNVTDSGACTAEDCLEAARTAFGHDTE